MWFQYLRAPQLPQEPRIPDANAWKMQRSLRCLRVRTAELLPVSVNGGGVRVRLRANALACRKRNISPDLQILTSPIKTRFQRGGEKKKGGYFNPNSGLWLEFGTAGCSTSQTRPLR